jgi:hypothetical protein
MGNQSEETTDVQGATTDMSPANSPRLIVRRSRSQRSRPAPNSLLGVRQQHRAAILGIHWLIANGTTASSCLLAASLLANLFLVPQVGRAQWEQEMGLGTLAVVAGLFLLAKVQGEVLRGGGLSATGWTYCLFLSLLLGVVVCLFAMLPLLLLNLVAIENHVLVAVWTLFWFGIGAGYCQAKWLELKWEEAIAWTLTSAMAIVATLLAAILVFGNGYDVSLGKSSLAIAMAGLTYGGITGAALIFIAPRQWADANADVQNAGKE